MLHTQVVGVVGGELLVQHEELKDILSQVFERLAEFGVHLRTTGSQGIEQIALQCYKGFIDSGNIAPTRVNVFLPWHGYNTLFRGYPGDIYTTLSVSNFKQCSNFVRLVHSHFTALSDKNQKMYATAPFVVFGRKLNRPADFLITYSPVNEHGKMVGSSVVASKLAEMKGIPVFNFASEDVEEVLIELRQYLRGQGFPVVSEYEVAHAS